MMEKKNNDAPVTLGIRIPIDTTKQSESTSDVNSGASFNDSQLADRLHFSKLSDVLDPNLGIMGELPSSNIAYDKNTFNPWNIEPHFLNILPQSTSSSNESFILVFGGINPSSVSKKTPPNFDDEDFVLGSTIFQYLLKSKTWKYYGTMMDPRCYHSCVVEEEYVYITGGYSLLKRKHGEMLAVSCTDRLNLSDKRWKSCANMNTSRAAHALVSHKGFLYTFGGRNSLGNILASVEVYNPVQDIWTEITSLPQPAMGLSATCVMDSIWLVGGITNDSSLDPTKCLSSNVFSFIPSIRRWCKEEPLPYSCAFTSCVSNDYSVWLVGGYIISKNSKDYVVSHPTVLQFLLSEKHSKWKPVASLRYPRHALSAVLYGDNIYAVAGMESDNKCASDKVEVIMGNISELCSNVPVPVAGCATVLVLSVTGDNTHRKDGGDEMFSLSEKDPSLFDGEKYYDSESYKTSTTQKEFTGSDKSLQMSSVLDKSDTEIKTPFEGSEKSEIKYGFLSPIFSKTHTERKESHEVIPGTEAVGDSFAVNDASKTALEQDSYDIKSKLHHVPDTKTEMYENNQTVEYRSSMEILVNPNEVHSKAYIKSKKDASKWLNFLEKLSLSDEKLHREVFQSKNAKPNIKTEANESSEVILAHLKSSDCQSFMYIKSNVTSKTPSRNLDVKNKDYQKSVESSDLEMDAISPNSTKITTNGDSFPIILLFGGENSKRPSQSRYILLYCCNEDSWKYAGCMPKHRCHHCAVILNNIIYIIGGYDSQDSKLYENITTKVLCYDILSEKWFYATDMNYSRANHATVVLQNKIYVIGGRDRLGNILSSVEVYSKSTNEWKESISLPYPVLGAAAFTSNCKLFLFGGITYDNDNEIITSKLAIFDPETDSWSTGPDLPNALAFCGVSILSNSAWLFGGLKEENGELVSSNDVFKLDMLSETWNKVLELSGPRFAHVTVSVGSKVYVIGGHSIEEKEEITACELIDLLKNEILLQKPLPVPVSARAGIVMMEMTNTS